MEECETLKQVAFMLTPLQKKVETELQRAGPWVKRKQSDIIHRMGPNRFSRQKSLQKLRHIQQLFVNWEGKDITTNSSELIYGK